MKSPRPQALKRLTSIPVSDTLVPTCQKARRSLSWGNPQRLDAGVSRERETLQRAKEEASASEAQICMRARVRRLVVLLVSIEIPFLKSVKRWNDSRTPVIHGGEYQVRVVHGALPVALAPR